MSGAWASMLAALPTSDKLGGVDRILTKVTSRAKRRDEIVLTTWKVWMPYHRIWVSCSDTDTSKTEKVATALNAMFCASAATERELLQLFRPKHLDRPLEEIDPEPTEVVCPYPKVDLKAIVEKLIKIHTEARDQLSEIEPQLVRSYRRMQWRYLFLPTTTGQIQREMETSTKVAELRSRCLAVEACLNMESSFAPLKVEDHDIFYIPMTVAFVGGSMNTTRYLLVDLTTGKVDAALTNLCELNEDFKTQLELSLHQRV